MTPLLLMLLTPARAGDACLSLAPEDAVWGETGEQTGALLGYAVAGGVDVDGDGGPDAVIGAPGGGDGGTAVVLLGLSGGEEAELYAGGSADLGAALGMGHLGGDTLGDVAVGAPSYDESGSDGGAVFLLWGSATFEEPWTTADADAVWTGEEAGALAGQAVAVGDVDGDARDDLLVGAPGDDTAAADAGAAYVVEGPVVSGGSLGDADLAVRGPAGGARAGWSVGEAGELDGVTAGFAVGAPRAGGAGEVAVFEAGLTGEVAWTDADLTVRGATNGDRFGRSLVACDVDGDGYRDLAIGASGVDGSGMDSGAVYVFSGPLAGTVAASSAVAVLEGAHPDGEAGWALSCGDVNGDDRDDLLVGAPGALDGGDAVGAASLVLGPVSGSVSLLDADARFVGGDDGDLAGWAVLVADLDGDPLSDLLIGAPGWLGEEEQPAGAAFAFAGVACASPDDEDRDGYTEDVDCDDEDPDVHPGADESMCDEVDADCDGELTDGGGADVYYADVDGDGFGDAASPIDGCDDPPTGAVDDDSDCDDGNAARHPDADEACNGVDDDCDGDVDEGCGDDTGTDDTGGDTDTDTDTETDEPSSGCDCEGRGTGGTWSLVFVFGFGARRRRKGFHTRA